MPISYERRRPVNRSRRLFFGGFILLCVLCVCAALWLGRLNAPTTDFPIDTDIVIADGLTLHEITILLEEQHVVHSSFMLYLALREASHAPMVQAGSYRFPEILSTRAVARALLSGDYQSPLVRVTFPEGFIAEELRSYYPHTYTPAPKPLSLIDFEGYLFPDTYHITGDMPEEELVALMRATFKEKIAPYADTIAASGFSEEEVIILASIIEREAKDAESKRIVSGILQNRLKIGMALQVDATLDYILGKTSAELTADDLKLDSPFNTYTHRGLPPAPIANPGIEAIEAVLYPEDTDNLYYLTGDDGTFHYAKTFEEHKRNKLKYLQ